MNLILIVTEAMRPIPLNIKANEFGPESVVNNNGEVLEHGYSVLIEGEPDNIKKWLEPFGHIWTSDNPAIGKWECISTLDNHYVECRLCHKIHKTETTGKEWVYHDSIGVVCLDHHGIIEWYDNLLKEADAKIKEIQGE